MKANYLESINAIRDLYKSKDGALGGYGHIVFDDGNVDCVESCIDDANEKKYSDDICEDTRIKSLFALKLMLPLTEEEREFVIRASFQYT